MAEPPCRGDSFKPWHVLIHETVCCAKGLYTLFWGPDLHGLFRGLVCCWSKVEGRGSRTLLFVCLCEPGGLWLVSQRLWTSGSHAGRVSLSQSVAQGFLLGVWGLGSGGVVQAASTRTHGLLRTRPDLFCCDVCNSAHVGATAPALCVCLCVVLCTLTPVWTPLVVAAKPELA